MPRFRPAITVADAAWGISSQAETTGQRQWRCVFTTRRSAKQSAVREESGVPEWRPLPAESTAGEVHAATEQSEDLLLLPKVGVRVHQRKFSYVFTNGAPKLRTVRFTTHSSHLGHSSRRRNAESSSNLDEVLERTHSWGLNTFCRPASSFPSIPSAKMLVFHGLYRANATARPARVRISALQPELFHPANCARGSCLSEAHAQNVAVAMG
jgi:hypothetical protein